MSYLLLIVGGFWIKSPVIICRTINCVQNIRKSPRTLKVKIVKQRSSSKYFPLVLPYFDLKFIPLKCLFLNKLGDFYI